MAAHTSSGVTAYRSFVFSLAIGFWFYQFMVTDLNAFGWQFRFLTVWGLSANVLVGWMMLRHSLGLSKTEWNPLVSAVLVLNIMVVFLYWRLWFTDPSLVNQNGPIPWYQEYYLHALGPALMAIDALFILGVYRRIAASFVVTILIFASYILWSELLVGPLNSVPTGSVTSGLPYPFLNSMELPARINFYGVTIGTATVFFVSGIFLSRMIGRLQGRRA